MFIKHNYKQLLLILYRKTFITLFASAAASKVERLKAKVERLKAKVGRLK